MVSIRYISKNTLTHFSSFGVEWYSGLHHRGLVVIFTHSIVVIESVRTGERIRILVSISHFPQQRALLQCCCIILGKSSSSGDEYSVSPSYSKWMAILYCIYFVTWVALLSKHRSHVLNLVIDDFFVVSPFPSDKSKAPEYIFPGSNDCIVDCCFSLILA